jgi:hypothetical protein
LQYASTPSTPPGPSFFVAAAAAAAAATAASAAAGGATDSAAPAPLQAFKLLVTPTYSTAALFSASTACTLLRFLLDGGRLTGEQLSVWMLTRGFSQWNARRAAQRLGLGLSGLGAGDPESDDEGDSGGGGANARVKGAPRRELLDMLPAPGSYGFEFGDAARAWRLEIVQGAEVLTPNSNDGTVCRKLDVAITVQAATFASARAAAEELFAAASDYAESLLGDPSRHVRVTTITGKGAGDFSGLRGREGATYLSKRPLATIYLPDAIKERANEEIAQFLRCKKDYARFGIPYRRSMLFAGPPGLGKTSLIHALASEHDLPIYMIAVGPQTTDSGLAAALRSVSDRRGALLVLEDVDALFTIERDQDSSKTKTALSFSGLLNALDGLSAPSGVVLMLTTNHIDRLDPALLRPGRIDTVYTFAPMSPANVGAMIAALVPSVPQAARDDIVARIRAEPACTGLSSAVLQKWLFDSRASADLASEVPKLVALCEFYRERAEAAHRRAPEDFYS